MRNNNNNKNKTNYKNENILNDIITNINGLYISVNDIKSQRMDYTNFSIESNNSIRNRTPTFSDNKKKFLIRNK